MKRILAILLGLLIAFSFSACKNKNDMSNENSEQSQISSDTSQIENYKLIRDMFVGQYKTTITDIQKSISVFDASDNWWGEFIVKQQTIEDLSDTFLKNEGNVPDEYKDDFNAIKDIVSQYTDAINQISQANGKSADEQTSIVSQSSRTINEANTKWADSIKNEL